MSKSKHSSSTAGSIAFYTLVFLILIFSSGFTIYGIVKDAELFEGESESCILFPKIYSMPKRAYNSRSVGCDVPIGITAGGLAVAVVLCGLVIFTLGSSKHPSPMLLLIVAVITSLYSFVSLGGAAYLTQGYKETCDLLVMETPFGKEKADSA